MPSGFRRQIWISITIILTSTAVFGIFTWKLGLDVTNTVQNIVTAREAFATENKRQEIFVQLRSNEAEADRGIARMSAVIPEEEQLFSFRQWAKNLGVVHNVSANVDFKKSPGKLSGAPSIAYETIGIDLEGRTESIISFLRAVELGADRFLLGLETLEMARGGNGYRMTGGAKVFYRAKNESPQTP